MQINYKYALNSSNGVVDVTQLQRHKLEKEEVFKCLGCGEILTPALGQKCHRTIEYNSRH